MGRAIVAFGDDALQAVGEVAILEHIFGLVQTGAFRALSVADHQTGPLQDHPGLLPAEVADFTVRVFIHPNGIMLVVAQDQKAFYARVLGKNGSVGLSLVWAFIETAHTVPYCARSCFFSTSGPRGGIPIGKR